MKKFAVLAVFLGLVSGGAFAGDVEKGRAKAAVCGSCHGQDGNTTLQGDYPKLAGQNAKYIVQQLKDFKSKARANDIMYGQVTALSDEDMENIAAYYASLDVQYAAVPDEFIEMGQRLYRAGDKASGIPACTACHGPQGNGLNAAGFAALGGQNPEYTIAQLKAFRNGSRENDPNRMMRDISAKLTDEQMKALAYYLVGLH
ncbi:cytochrome c [Pleionea sp. CnH1-48]|uniref:c-type cytochrome n=1 Tax=Pleionea sp. CnH1-48 TaxID=2954494 RepID=UPI0020971566|nr:c-type cytochrome [Pleionea sp. CnH1-48]MCO7226282.1 cytochrome c4 [Pleionea sp. CnH1-48]